MQGILQHEFESFLRAVYPEPPMGDQLVQVRDAFFGGALISQGREIDEMKAIAAELAQYLIDFRARHNLPQEAS